MVDSIRACVDDLKEGGKEIEEYERVRLEKIREYEEGEGKKQEGEVKRQEQAMKNIEMLQKAGGKGKGAKASRSAPPRDEDYAFDEEYEPTHSTPVYNSSPPPILPKEANKPPKHHKGKQPAKYAKEEPQQRYYQQEPRYDQTRPPQKNNRPPRGYQ